MKNNELKINNNIVELKYSTFVDYIPQGVVYREEELIGSMEWREVKEVLEDLSSLDKMNVNILYNINKDYIIDYLKEELLYHYDLDVLIEMNNIKKVIFEDLEQELIDEWYYRATEEEKEQVFYDLGLQVGSAGYSNWATIIAYKDLNINYLKDLWDGNNFYDMQLYDNQGNMMESISELWYPDLELEEIQSYIKAYFGIDNPVFIDNEIVQYIDIKPDLVEEVNSVSYRLKK